jgi:hypothetical protein
VTVRKKCKVAVLYAQLLPGSRGKWTISAVAGNIFHDRKITNQNQIHQQKLHGNFCICWVLEDGTKQVILLYSTTRGVTKG